MGRCRVFQSNSFTEFFAMASRVDKNQMKMMMTMMR